MDAASILYLMQALGGGGGGAQRYNPNLKLSEDAQQSASQFIGSPMSYSYQFPSSSPTYTYNMGSQGGGQSDGTLAALLAAAFGGQRQQQPKEQAPLQPLDYNYAMRMGINPSSPPEGYYVGSPSLNKSTGLTGSYTPGFSASGQNPSIYSGTNAQGIKTIGAPLTSYGTGGGPGRQGAR